MWIVRSHLQSFMDGLMDGLQVGALTKSLIAEEKIWLLVDFVPFFATPEKKARLLLLPPILEKAVAAVQGVVVS